jgi:Putative DNA-binding domain
MDGSRERSFAEALLNPTLTVPQGILSDDALRFAIHRNNVVFGLVKAVEARFPVVGKLVGQDFFTAMARAFVIALPPGTPLLASYGDDFPDFISVFAPARELPYLADVARIEAARTHAYNATDATPLAAIDLEPPNADALVGLRLTLHPSLKIIRSEHPIVTIWAMNSGEQKLSPIESWNAEDALVVRPHLDVYVRRLPQGSAAFLLALAEGRALGPATDAAFAECPEFDLTGDLAQLISFGLVCGVAVTQPGGRNTP